MRFTVNVEFQQTNGLSEMNARLAVLRAAGELLEHLYLLYRREAPTMAYTMEQFIRDTHRMVIEDAIQHDLDSILKHFDPEHRLKGLDPEQRLKGLDPEQRLKGLDPEFIKEWLGKQRQDH